jgi:hypothetical protein
MLFISFIISTKSWTSLDSMSNPFVPPWSKSVRSPQLELAQLSPAFAWDFGKLARRQDARKDARNVRAIPGALLSDQIRRQGTTPIQS